MDNFKVMSFPTLRSQEDWKTFSMDAGEQISTLGERQMSLISKVAFNSKNLWFSNPLS